MNVSTDCMPCLGSVVQAGRLGTGPGSQLNCGLGKHLPTS